MKYLLQRVSILLALALPASFCFAADGSQLKPPTGAKVAVVVFEDMECPSCAHAYPVIFQTAKASHVPVVLHDFPLAKHPWSFQAAVYARFFDTKKLGNDFRGFIYKNQADITPGNLVQYASKFANDKKLSLPFAIDPQGELKAQIQADYNLGEKCGLNQTPTIFVVGGSTASSSFTEVTNLDTLSSAIEKMQKKFPATPAKSSPAASKGQAKTSHK
jgi:protein-disulfide isomerase